MYRGCVCVEFLSCMMRTMAFFLCSHVDVVGKFTASCLLLTFFITNPLVEAHHVGFLATRIFFTWWERNQTYESGVYCRKRVLVINCVTKLLVLIPGLLGTAAVQYLSLYNHCSSKEPALSCKPCQNTYAFYWGTQSLHLHMLCCDDVSFKPPTLFVTVTRSHEHMLSSSACCVLSACPSVLRRLKLNDYRGNRGSSVSSEAKRLK